MDRTKISWAQSPDGKPGATWNPTDGCEECSPGCKNCYAKRMAGRFSAPGKPYHGLVELRGKPPRRVAMWTGVGRLNKNSLLKPLHWRAPKGVFVDSMSDLFFEPITDEEIAACFGVMAAARQHRYMILTKRGKRMRDWYQWLRNSCSLEDGYNPRDVLQYYTRLTLKDVWHNYRPLAAGEILGSQWPLPNVWQGVSVENKKHGVPRIDYLREVDATVRWLSIEPLLEDLGELDLRGIHFVVLGCESGPRARDCRPEWLRSIIKQCEAQNVKVWLKQAVAWDVGKTEIVPMGIGFGPGSDLKGRGFGGRVIERPYLDGRQYLEMP